MPKKLFEPGNPGRPKGTPNKLTRTVREVVLDTFNKIQLDPKHNLESFAKANPKEFYQIAAKLIPTEVTATVEGSITIPQINIIRKDATEGPETA